MGKYLWILSCCLLSFFSIFAHPTSFVDKALESAQALLPDDPVWIQAGAYFGDQSAIIATRWPNGRVLALEPMPHSFVKLSAQASIYPNIEVYPLALGMYNGVSTLYICYGTTGEEISFASASSLLTGSNYMQIHYQGPTIEVPCVRLDDWCEEHLIQADALWLELEGMELQAIMHGQNTLDNVKVLVVATYFQSFRRGMTQFRDLLSFLERKGFVLLEHDYYEGYQGTALFIR